MDRNEFMMPHTVPNKPMNGAALAVVANWAAGLADSAQEVDLKRAEPIWSKAMEQVHRILEAVVAHEAD